MVPQGDASFPKQVLLLFPAAEFLEDVSMNHSILSSGSTVSRSSAGSVCCVRCARTRRS